MKMIKNIRRSVVFLCLFVLAQTIPALAVDLQVLGGTYDQAEYPGYPTKGTYLVELSKDNYAFTAGQFEINISLPQQGAYDPARAAEAVIPAGWELVANTNTSLILRLLPGNIYAGTGAAANRRKNFLIPIITSAPIVDNPSLVTVQWNDFEVDEATTANSAGSALNVADVNLPVTLVSFSAAREDQTALLSWSTSEETNSDRFEIERSENGKSWNKIGMVESGKESKIIRRYAFTDKSPLNGENLYRLKMVDRDATFAYSGIRSVKFDVPQGVYVYPNPAADYVKLDGALASTVRKVEIVRVDGSIVYQSATVSPEGIDVRKLMAGTYVFKIINQNGALNTQKLVIQR